LKNNGQEFLAYLEELPEINAFGQTLCEAQQKVMQELLGYALATSSEYTIEEIKYKISSSS
jgi:predicted RNase H-like HicB family nuclease